MFSFLRDDFFMVGRDLSHFEHRLSTAVGWNFRKSFGVHLGRFGGFALALTSH